MEFAFILPLFMLLICGIIEFGVIFHDKQVVVNASREAARAGITGANNMIEIARNYCNGRLIGLSGDITPEMVDVVADDDGIDLVVTVGFGYNLLFGDIINIDRISVTGRTVMRMEPPL